MILTLRHADTATAARYPLECSGPLPWRAAGNVHTASIALPEIPAGSILAPSLALLSNEDYRFQFTLTLGGTRWRLHPVPCAATPPDDSDAVVATHIDCYHVQQTIRGAVLEVEITNLAELGAHLLAVTARPLQLASVPVPMATVRCPAPPPVSQLSLGETLGPRVCSPTCITMLLSQFGKRPELAEVSAACFDAVSNLYGVWPMALRAASRAGCIGAVELFDDWERPQRILAAGLPVIASIRFEAGSLPGAPLAASGGHLVVVHGIDPHQVLVCDPAASEAAAVPRAYAAASFARAWLEHRGAAYILLP